MILMGFSFSVMQLWCVRILPSELITLFFPQSLLYSMLGEMTFTGLLLLWCSLGGRGYSPQGSKPYFTFPSFVCPGGKLGGLGYLYKVIHVWCNHGLCGYFVLCSRLHNNLPKVVCSQQPQGNSLLYEFSWCDATLGCDAALDKAHIMILFTHWSCFTRLGGGKSNGGIQHMISKPCKLLESISKTTIELRVDSARTGLSPTFSLREGGGRRVN